MARTTYRRGGRRNLAGLLVTLALHGGILGAIGIAQSRSAEPVEGPRDFVVAKMVKLGKPRDKFWLPRITQPRSKAPAPTMKISEDPNAAAAPKEAPRPDDPEISKDLKRALERARKLAAIAEDAPDEGLETGSPLGTATEATEGDAYATSVAEAIRKNWTSPSGLVSEAELGRLVTTIRVRIGEDGKLYDEKLLKTSGNTYYDDSCLAAVRATVKVPPPPLPVRRVAARGFALEFAGKDLK